MMYKIIHIPTARIVSRINTAKWTRECIEYCFFNMREQAIMYLNRPWTHISVKIPPILQGPDNTVFLTTENKIYQDFRFNRHEFEVVKLTEEELCENKDTKPI